MNKLNTAYFGSPDFSARLLEKLIQVPGHPFNIILVVTQPDQPVGRRKLLTPTPVKSMAHVHNLEVYDAIVQKNVEELDEQEGPIPSFNLILKERKIDLAIVYAYSELIPEDILVIPSHGFINVHPSLLPAYRGPAPIAYPLMLGDTRTGTSIMRMDKELDHGPVIVQKPMDIQPADMRRDIESKLTDLSFELLTKVDLSAISGTPQDHEAATFTRKLEKEDGFLPFDVLKKAFEGKPNDSVFIPPVVQDFSRRPESYSKLVWNLFRGLSPWPGIWTKISVHGHEKRLKILDMEETDHHLRLKSVQLEGKNPVDFLTFNTAYDIFR